MTKKIWYWGAQEPNPIVSTRTNGSALYPYAPYLLPAKAFVSCLVGFCMLLVVWAFVCWRGNLPLGAQRGRQVAPDLAFSVALCRPGGLEGAEVTSSGQWWPPAVPRPLHATLATRAPGEGTGGGASCLPSSGTATICCSARSPRVPRRAQLQTSHHGGAGTRWVVAGRPPRSGPQMHRETLFFQDLTLLRDRQGHPTQTELCAYARLRDPLPNSDFAVGLGTREGLRTENRVAGLQGLCPCLLYPFQQSVGHTSSSWKVFKGPVVQAPDPCAVLPREAWGEPDPLDSGLGGSPLAIHKCRRG